MSDPHFTAHAITERPNASWHTRATSSTAFVLDRARTRVWASRDSVRAEPSCLCREAPSSNILKDRPPWSAIPLSPFQPEAIAAGDAMTSIRPRTSARETNGRTAIARSGSFRSTRNGLRSAVASALAAEALRRPSGDSEIAGTGLPPGSVMRNSRTLARGPATDRADLPSEISASLSLAGGPNRVPPTSAFNARSTAWPASLGRWVEILGGVKCIGAKDGSGEDLRVLQVARNAKSGPILVFDVAKVRLFVLAGGFLPL